MKARVSSIAESRTLNHLILNSNASDTLDVQSVPWTSNVLQLDT